MPLSRLPILFAGCLALGAALVLGGCTEPATTRPAAPVAPTPAPQPMPQPPVKPCPPNKPCPREVGALVRADALGVNFFATDMGIRACSQYTLRRLKLSPEEVPNHGEAIERTEGGRAVHRVPHQSGGAGPGELPGLSGTSAS